MNHFHWCCFAISSLLTIVNFIINVHNKCIRIAIQILSDTGKQVFIRVWQVNFIEQSVEVRAKIHRRGKRMIFYVEISVLLIIIRCYNTGNAPSIESFKVYGEPVHKIFCLVLICQKEAFPY